MKSRTAVIATIILAWILLVSIIFFVSSYISVVGLKELEKEAAVDDTNRVYRILVSNFENIFSLNYDAAFWDETYAFVQKQNKDYLEKNFSEDLFKDYKLNYVIFLNKSGELVWSFGYDLIKKSKIEVPSDLIDYFKTNSLNLLKNKEDYNDLEKKPEGVGGFLKTSDANVLYFALNNIKDSEDTKPFMGFLIYGKILTPDLLKRLSNDFNYHISLIPISDFTKTSENKEIFSTLTATNDSVYTKAVNENSLVGYRLLQDVSFNPIAVIQVEFPRTLYMQSRKTSFYNRLMLLAFSLAIMLGLSSLLYYFFKRQDLLTSAFERFVPRQLIDLLQKKDIIEVNLGNSSERTVSVLFMDIRNFTTISESLSPQDNFDFINTILKEIAPMIGNNGGFIDKYIGDAIMALFPHTETNADDAVRAGMMILDEMDKLNYTGKLKTASPVKVGIGINTGNAIFGIIGASGRLEATVISDSINTASRIEPLTKTYQCPMLISEETYRAMKHPEYYSIAHVDDVQVKGKSVKTSIYKVEKRH